MQAIVNVSSAAAQNNRGTERPFPVMSGLPRLSSKVFTLAICTVKTLHEVSI